MEESAQAGSDARLQTEGLDAKELCMDVIFPPASLEIKSAAFIGLCLGNQFSSSRNLHGDIGHGCSARTIDCALYIRELDYLRRVALHRISRRFPAPTQHER